jgi:hypothetical protein
MAQYQVRGPDGQIHVFEGPDGATPDQVTAGVAQFFAAQHQKIANQIATDPISQGARDITGDMSGLDTLRAGFGKAFSDLGQGAGQLVGLTNRADVAETRKLDSPLMRTGGGITGNILGNITALAPSAMIPGAATLPGAAAIGAVTGLIQPSTSTGETLKNTGIGTAAGLAVPLAQRLWQVGKAAAEPLYQAGQERIVGRTLNAAAGQDAPAVAQRLADVAKPFVGPSQGIQRTTMGELVPGSLPTVGQGAENAGIASLERAAAANNPSVTNAISDTMQAQNAARTGLLTDMAGTDGARTFFDANRKAAAQQLYDKAYKAGLPDLTAAQQATVSDLMKRPAIKSAMDDARVLAANEGVDLTNAGGSVKGLDYVKRALDDQIANSTGNQQRILQGVKDKLVGFLDEVSPDYANARKTFGAMSQPINQMDVAAQIADKSVNKLTGTLQPAAFARSLSDKTAQQATGFGKATLEGTMSPSQMNGLNSILLDVQRSNAAQNAGRGAGSDTIQKLAYSNLMDQSGVPTFMQNMKPLQVLGNLAARGGDAVYGRANKEISGLLGEVMLDPGKASLLMKNATPAQRSQILGLLGTVTQGGLLSAPASVYASQQQ